MYKEIPETERDNIYSWNRNRMIKEAPFFYKSSGTHPLLMNRASEKITEMRSQRNAGQNDRYPAPLLDGI